MIKVNLNSSRRPDCVVFVDAENIGGVGVLYELLEQIAPFGNRFGLLAYGVTLGQVKAYLNAGFQVVSNPGGTRHKNFVDLQISVAATEIAVRYRSVRTFVIASGDADFVPLADKLKQLGRTVVQIGGAGPVSRQLSQAVNVALMTVSNTNTTKPVTHSIALKVWTGRIAAELQELRNSRANSLGVNLADLGQALKSKFDFSPRREFGLKWKTLCELLARQNGWTVRTHNGIVRVSS